MIRAQRTAAAVAAVIICDVCRQRITDSSSGAVHYRGDSGADGFCDVFHVHKGACQARAEAQHGQPSRPWHELIEHLNELRRNSGTSFKALVLREAGQALPADRYNHLCEKMDEVCTLLGADVA
jgi:hypothetical protein